MELQSKEDPLLLSLAFTFASLVFKDPQEAEWLGKEMLKMKDLMTESIVYRTGKEDGEVKGEIKGKIKGKIKGRVEEAITLLQETIQGRFPVLSPLAKKQITHLHDPEVLHRLTIKIILAQSQEEVESYLLEIVN
jgi:predicted transposase YdaD